MADFTHFNENGRAKMVDVSEKADTVRTAVAAGRVLVNAETFELIKTGGMKKGDVLNVAQVGGIMGAKRTSDIIPMCHPIMISGVDIDISLCEERHSVEIIATTKCTGATGVEMEALTAVSVAALPLRLRNSHIVQRFNGVHHGYTAARLGLGRCKNRLSV